METARKKTSGGVFMTLVKIHPAMTVEIKRKLQKCERDRARAKRFTVSLLQDLAIETKEDSSGMKEALNML